MSEQWYFIDSGENSPSFNMAMDEVLLDWHSRGLLPPILRFYSWKPAALSLGHFQKTVGRIDVDKAKAIGVEIVRRPTGGLAVLHDKELTYSVVLSEKHDKMSPSIIEAYRVLSQGILEGYRYLGIQADLAIPNAPIGKTVQPFVLKNLRGMNWRSKEKRRLEVHKPVKRELFYNTARFQWKWILNNYMIYLHFRMKGEE